MYRFAIIGAGNIAHIHAKAIREIKNVKLLAVYSSSIERAKKFAEIYNIKPYDSIEEMFKNENIDIVNIVTKNYQHIEHGILSAKNNKHIIVEKPLGNSFEEAQKLVKLCKEKNLKLSVVSQRRWDTSIRILKVLIENKKIGEVKQANLALKFARPQEYYDSNSSWRKNKKLSGGGVLINQAIHFIDVAQWLLGKPISVYAETKILSHNIPIEDYVSAILKFKNNAVAKIIATTAVKKDIPDSIEIYSNKGVIVIKGRKIIKNTILPPSKNKILSWLIQKINNYKFQYGSHKQQIQNFINSIKYDKKPLIDGYEGLKVLKIIDNLYLSSKFKKEIKIKWN